MFYRSREGLANLRLFYRVDVVLFVEGGSSEGLSDDVKAPLAKRISDDQMFWENVFGSIFPNESIKAIPVGSKASALEVLERMSGAVRTGIGVAVDRDYSHMLSPSRPDRPLVLTHGYSWESEYSELILLYRLLDRIIPTVNGGADYKKDIRETYAVFFRQARRLLFIDYNRYLRGLTTVLRRTPGRYVDRRAGKYPKLKVAEVLSVLRKAKKKDRAPGAVNLVKPYRLKRRDLYGKLIFEFSHATLEASVARYARTSRIPKALLNGIMISCLRECLRSGELPYKRSYYKTELAKLLPR